MVISAHCVLKKINIEKLINSLKKYVAVFGNQIPIWRGKKITKRYIWSHFTKERQTNLFSSIENRYFLHNAFCFYNKQILLDNPFDESLSSKEDRYWAADMVKKGYNFLCQMISKVEHL